jgi:DNA primase
MISRETIDKIYQVAIIEDVVGEFVNLKKAGSSYRGLSPFANEKTPSFYVVPSKGIYKDFSSGKGGNVVDFLMQHEKFSYPEALRWLAAKYNIDIEEDEQSPEDQKEKSEREQLSIVTEFAARYFHDQLIHTEEGKLIGYSYFEERGFRHDTIVKFQLGYCPDGWDKMTSAAIEQQYNVEYLLKTGLTRQRDEKYYDFFRGRVMFPIHNVSGKVIAFGGRTLKAEKDIAKYFNSPESELYNKSNVLYGLFLAKNSIVKYDMCYLAEGYTDVISMHQAGIENVVSSSGTSLTEGQVRMIRRYTTNLTIIYDGDAAGIKASLRGIDMVLAEGMNVKLVLLPDGDDPDSFARKHTAEEFNAYVSEHSRNFIEFKTALLKEEAGKDPIKRAEMIRSIAESISKIPDQIKRVVFLQESARILGVKEDLLLQEINRMMLQRGVKTPFAEKPVEEIPENLATEDTPELNEISVYYQERDIIRLMLNYVNRTIIVPAKEFGEGGEDTEMKLGNYILHNLENDELRPEDDVLHKIYQEYLTHLHDSDYPESIFFTQHSNLEISSAASNLLIERHVLSEWEKREIYPTTEESQLYQAASISLFEYRMKFLTREIVKVTTQLAENPEDDNLLLAKVHLDRQRFALSQIRRRVITH